MRGCLWLAALLLFPSVAVAQPAPGQPGTPQLSELACQHAPRGLDRDGRAYVLPAQPALNDPGVYGAFMRLRAELRYTPTLEVQRVALDARWNRQNLEITVPKADPGTFYTVFMVPREAMNRAGRGDLREDGALRARAMPAPRVADGDPTLLQVSFERPFFYTFLYWRAFVLPCHPREGMGHLGTGYAEQDVLLTGRFFAVLLGLGVAALIMGGLGMAAYAINGWQLDAPPGVGRPRGGFLARFSPVFICQDAFGHASLARFQVLLFTVVLLGVYAYAFAAAQEAPQVSPSVLALAGITLAGSTLAAAASRPSLESANRLWLNGTGVVPRQRRVPRWHDLISSDGEVDITRMQALGFSLFAAVAVVFQGAQNLGSFAIPEQLNYLIGLSQAVYVAGKALPVDSLKRLNEDLAALRVAERPAIGKPADAPEVLEFMRLKAGIAVSLFDVFGERLDRERLEELRPGGRMAGSVMPTHG